METEMETMKNDIVLANTQPTATIPVVAQQNNSTFAAAQRISAHSAATQPITIQPVAATQPVVVDACLNPVTTGLGAAMSAIIIKEKSAVFIDTHMNQEQVLHRCKQSNRGSSVANLDISPISNNVVKLLLSEQD